LEIAPSRRAATVEYAIRDVIGKAEELKRKGRRIIYLNIGDPVRYGFDTPTHIKEALQKSVQNGMNYYSASEGLKELREAVAEKEKSVNGVEVEPRHVVITSGISEAILFLMAALVDPGDEILIPGPCYPPYLSYAKFFDGKAVTYRTEEGRGWAPDLEDIERKITEHTRLLLIINPNNPTGSVYSREELEEILALAASRNIAVAADEIYDRIIYDAKFTSVASIAKDVPVIGLNGFSKTYLMTGWRLGYLYLHDPQARLSQVWDAVERLSRVRLCASTPAQMAAVQALRGPQDHIREMVSLLRQRRDFTLNRISRIPGLEVSKPEGAFYVFPKVSLKGKWRTDVEFVSDLLTETGVLVVHGSGFDPSFGRDHFRAVFLPEEKILGEAMDAIEGFMKQHM